MHLERLSTLFKKSAIYMVLVFTVAGSLAVGGVLTGALAAPVTAQPTCENDPEGLCTATPPPRTQAAIDCKEGTDPGNCAITRRITQLINMLSAMVGIVVVGMIIWGGIQYTAAKDDPQALSAAKGKIRNAIIALLMYFFMYSFLQWLVPGGII